jgi:hypothetical protein
VLKKSAHGSVNLEVRMIEKFLKNIVKYYQASFLIIFICTLGIVLYFWKLGFVNGSRGQDLHKASFIIETYESKNVFKDVKQLITNENPKQAIIKIKDIEKDFKKINDQVEVQEFVLLQADLQKLKTSSANLISFSKVEKVIKVFNGKMATFYHYVQKNNWRTLSRMSDRVLSQTSGHLNKKKLTSLVSSLSREFSTMEKIIGNSVLPRKDKAEVISRLSNLKIEINMLKKYVDERKFFYQIYAEANKLMQKWMSTVAPEITLQKIQIEQIGKYYVMGFGAIAFLSLILFLVSFLLNRFYFRSAQMSFEKKMKIFIDKNLLAGEMLAGEGFSPEFIRHTHTMSDYLNKRMSFGSVFQDALPLSSVLLDKNLKVQWANKQFCEDWKISEDEINKDYMSWDYLSKLTNLGNNDPILEALKHQIAGIYQVHVKPNDTSPARPYEMFVSPVDYQGQTRIMLFFYDLTNLEETIQDQAQSLISPIRRSLTMMQEDQFQASEDLESDFNIADISDVYNEFLELHTKVTNENQRLISEIESLHNKLSFHQQRDENVRGNLGEKIVSSRNNIELLKSFKKNIITLMNLSHKLEKANSSDLELIHANNNALKNGVGKINKLKEISQDVIKSLPKLNQYKDELRDNKTIMYEFKLKLGHELKQLKSQVNRVEGQASVDKVKQAVDKTLSSFEVFDGHVENLDKNISGLELLMSKSQLILSSNQSQLADISSDYEQQQLKLSDSEVKMLRKKLNIFQSEIESVEQSLVGDLQAIFKEAKQSVFLSSHMDSEYKSSHY